MVSFAPVVQWKEAFGQDYLKQICVITPDPFGAKTAELEKAKLFVARCYKVMTTTSTCDEEVQTVMAILDTEADPKLIRENALPEM